MGRKLRYLPEEGALVEVTCRTLQGRLLLRPSPELNDIAAGVLGRAQRLYPVDLIAISLLSTHYHMIVLSTDVARSPPRGRAGAKHCAPETEVGCGGVGPESTSVCTAQPERLDYVPCSTPPNSELAGLRA